MAKYAAAKKNEAKQRAHQRDEAAKKKAAREAAKLEKRRQKDKRVAAKKSQAVAEEKMERLAAKSKRDLEKLEKMRRSIVAKGSRIAPRSGPAKRVSVVDDIVSSIPGIKIKKRAAPRAAPSKTKNDSAATATAKKARKTETEETARRKETEAALARLTAKGPEEDTSESEDEVRPYTRSRRRNN